MATPVFVPDDDEEIIDDVHPVPEGDSMTTLTHIRLQV